MRFTDPRGYLKREVMKEYPIREMNTHDIDRFRELYKAVWGFNRPLGFDKWRLFDTPHGTCPTAVAMDGDRFAGLYTLWPISLYLAGTEVLGGQSMDTMTHPDHQGRGLFTKLALASYEIAASRGVKALYGFPNPNSYPGFVNKLNWDHTGDITHYIRLLRISNHPRVPTVVKPVCDIVAHLIPKGKFGPFRITNKRPPEESIIEIIASDTEPNVCSISKSTKWFQWRYTSESENGYKWITAYSKNDKACGFGVWGMREEGWGGSRDMRAHLVELVGASEGAKRAVLAAIIKEAFESHAMLLETLCSYPSTERVLRRAGFIRHRRAPLITRKTTTSNLPANIHNHSTWRIIGGDVDTF
tara:strand:- start:1256 stop:2329 length:1074 start_codon:yes stop_codon:yes gene_type:complete